MATREGLATVLSNVQDVQLYEVQRRLDIAKDADKIRRLQLIRRDLRHLAQEIRLEIKS